MVRSVEHYPSETIVVVHAKLRKAPVRIKNATIHDHELEVYEVHKVGDLTENVPFTVYDAENINRDQEDDEDIDDDAGSLGVLSGDDTPVDSPRQSTDMSRMSIDKVLVNSQKGKTSKEIGSRSECPHMQIQMLVLTVISQRGRLPSTPFTAPTSPS